MAKKMKKTVPWVLILAMVVLLGMGFYFQVPKVREAANLATSADFAPNFAYAATVAATGATVADTAPTVSDVSLNAGDDFAPTENTVTTVDITGKISEPNRGEECTTITAVAYISGLGSGCSADDNECYRDISCSTAIDGTLISATCAVPIWFFAHPTDAGSSKEGSTWTASILATDAASNTAEAEYGAPESDYTTAYYLDVTASIAYGSVDPGGDTGAITQTTVVTVTGNAAIDCSLKGTDMTGGTNGTIAADKQKYGLTNTDYDVLTYALSTANAAFGLPDAVKPSTTPSDSIEVVYWGLGVNYETPAAADYSGTNIFTPAGD